MDWLLNTIQTNPLLTGIFFLWVAFWKGWALWRAANRQAKFWFVAILLFNTIGLLEILYLLLGDREIIPLKRWWKALKTRLPKWPKRK